jgi:hypothetical protein
MVGHIESYSDAQIAICIQRNQRSLWRFNQAKDLQSFTLILDGSLPVPASGQIWDLKVRRVGGKLVVVARQPYAPGNEERVWLEQNAKRAKAKAANDESKANATNKSANQSQALAPSEATDKKTITPGEESSLVAANTNTLQQQPVQTKAQQPQTRAIADATALHTGSNPESSAQTTLHPNVLARPQRQQQQKTPLQVKSSKLPPLPT